jgi:hypothetical protein
MELSRFFFADAASQSLVMRIFDNNGELFGQALDLILKVNTALRFIIEHYLRIRSSEVKQFQVTKC